MVTIHYGCTLVMTVNELIKNTQGTISLVPCPFYSLFTGIEVHQGKSMAGSYQEKIAVLCIRVPIK